MSIITPEKSAEFNIGNAARLAAVVFDAAQWTYFDIGVPDHEELESTIRDLLRNMNETDNISTGRISIEKDELSGYTIHLEIGTLSEEEFDALDIVPKNILEGALEQFKNNGT